MFNYKKFFENEKYCISCCETLCSIKIKINNKISDKFIEIYCVSNTEQLRIYGDYLIGYGIDKIIRISLLDSNIEFIDKIQYSCANNEIIIHHKNNIYVCDMELNIKELYNLCENYTSVNNANYKFSYSNNKYIIYEREKTIHIFLRENTAEYIKINKIKVRKENISPGYCYELNFEYINNIKNSIHNNIEICNTKEIVSLNNDVLIYKYIKDTNIITGEIDLSITKMKSVKDIINNNIKERKERKLSILEIKKNKLEYILQNIDMYKLQLDKIKEKICNIDKHNYSNSDSDSDNESDNDNEY